MIRTLFICLYELRKRICYGVLFYDCCPGNKLPRRMLNDFDIPVEVFLSSRFSAT